MKGWPETHEPATDPFGHGHADAVSERRACGPLSTVVVDGIRLKYVSAGGRVRVCAGPAAKVGHQRRPPGNVFRPCKCGHYGKPGDGVAANCSGGIDDVTPCGGYKIGAVRRNIPWYWPGCRSAGNKLWSRTLASLQWCELTHVHVDVEVIIFVDRLIWRASGWKHVQLFCHLSVRWVKGFPRRSWQCRPRDSGACPVATSTRQAGLAAWTIDRSTRFQSKVERQLDPTHIRRPEHAATILEIRSSANRCVSQQLGRTARRGKMADRGSKERCPAPTVS